MTLKDVILYPIKNFVKMLIISNFHYLVAQVVDLPEAAKQKRNIQHMSS